MTSRIRSLLSLLIALAVSGCGGENQDRLPSTAAQAPVNLPDSSTVSYANAAEWMAHLDKEEKADQVADWAAFGLAALLQMDVEALRDFYYDKTPVRDAFFDDLATNSVGPGRSLPDGRGTLHLLVPQDDRHAVRTVALLLDDHRQNTGSDPERVRVHRYRDDRAAKAVRLVMGPESPTAEVRTRHGHVEQSVNTLEELEGFLSRSQHLSRLEVRDGGVWAAGWSWPGVPEGRITPEDVAVLQRGYESAAQGLTTEPGFSLDPGEPVTDRDELVHLLAQANYRNAAAVVDGLGAIKERYGTVDRRNPDLNRATVAALEQELGELYYLYGDVVDFTHRVMLGHPAYQYARYDGGLAGTEAGMTYFYTDLVAKAWPMEKGTGTPAGRVAGFVSDLDAKTPWSHCTAGSESGRLWFGLREDAVSLYDDRVDFGQLATRLFSRVNDPQVRDREIEPSYSFGRIMWWWDRHYMAMADYEPQYHRLDQLMRWGTAIGWLVDHAELRLPAVPADQIDEGQRFGSWLAAHRELKWRYDIPFVSPRGVTTEAFPILISDSYEDCGNGRAWSGGISNPSRQVLSDLRTSRPALTEGVARGGMSAEYTNFSRHSRAGIIGNRTLTRTLEPVQGSATRVEVAARGRKVWSLSILKAAVSETAERRLGLSFSSTRGRLSQRLQVQGHELGELSATVREQGVTVQWRPSVLDRTRRALASLQEALLVRGRSLNDAAAHVKGASLVYTEPGTGRVLLRMDGGRPGDSRWVAVEEGVAQPGNQMAFQMGAPNPRSSEPRWFSAQFTNAPQLVDEAGGAVEWLEVRRGGSASRVTPGGPPGGTSRLYTVRYPDGRSGRIYFEGDRVRAAVNDPLFGLQGTRQGAALMDPAVLHRLQQLRQREAPGGAGYAHAMGVGDETVVMVDGSGITLVDPTHPWHERVQAALASGDDAPVWMKVENGNLVLAQRLESGRVGPPGGPTELRDVLAYLRGGDSRPTRGPPVLLERDLARIVFEEGRLPTEAVGAEWQVRIVEVEASSQAAMASIAPDRALWDGAEWVPARASATATDRAGSGPLPAVRTFRLLYHADDCNDEKPQASARRARCEG